jgi:hypothetical protein
MILDLAELVERLVHGVALGPRVAMQSPSAPVIRFENAACLHTAMNPNFFKGMVVEGAVARAWTRGRLRLPAAASGR